MHAYATESRSQVYGYLAVLATVIALILNRALDYIGWQYGWLVGAPSVGGAFVLLLGMFNVWAWRWRWLHRVGVVATPVIDGTYDGVLRSSYQGGIDVPVRIIIEQHWLGILIRFEVLGSETSSSRSVTAAVRVEGYRDARLIYTYLNQVRPGYADADMADHDGTAEVIVTADGRIDGRYFNFRGRQGRLTLNRTPSE